MIRTIVIALVAFAAGYWAGRRPTRVELRVLDLYMEQLDRLRKDQL